MTKNREMLLHEARTTRDLDAQLVFATSGDWEVEQQLALNSHLNREAIHTEQCRLFLATVAGEFNQAEYDRLGEELPLTVQRAASVAAAEYVISE